MVSKRVGIIVAVIAFVVVSSFIFYMNDRRESAGYELHESHDKFEVSPEPGGSCKSCSAIDPVLEPAYNLKNIAMQSVLLEEHLAEPKKRCPSCICKHFLHVIGLAQEAVTLAGSRVDEYEYLDGLGHYYETTFEDWKKAKKCNNNIRDVGERLRKMRNQLTKTYVMNS